MARKKQHNTPEPHFKPNRLRWRTEGQREYIRNVASHDINFVTGPAGTGKTHIAVGIGVEALQAGAVETIVLTRPLVGVGKDMGYLPGTVGEKVGPYIQPCFDELSYFVSQAGLREMIYSKTIQIVPLSMMRGRTFNNAFVILDEAQNSTRTELKTFLTRLGMGSKMVIVGDSEQSDLYGEERGAFTEAISRLKDLSRVSVFHLGTDDIVRNPVIAELLEHLW